MRMVRGPSRQGSNGKYRVKNERHLRVIRHNFCDRSNRFDTSEQACLENAHLRVLEDLDAAETAWLELSERIEAYEDS